MKYIYVIACLFACVLGVKNAQAAELPPIESIRSGVVEISAPLIIDPEDKLKIAPGTKLRFTGNGYLYVKGVLIIGESDQPATSSAHMVEIESLNQYPAIQVDGGLVTGRNIRYRGGAFLEAYRHASTTIVDSELIDTLGIGRSIISIYQNSSMHMDGVQVRSLRSDTPGQGQGMVRSTLITAFTQSSLDIKDSSFDSDISQRVFMVYGNGSVSFRQSAVSSCEIWLMMFGSSSASGGLNQPTCSPNPVIIYDDSQNSIEFEEVPCCSSVFFIPGLQGSRLYHKKVTENQLWEPNHNADVEKLYLDASGNSILQGIYARGIIEKTNVAGSVPGTQKSIYDGFIDYLKSLVANDTVNAYEAMAYDWRKAPDQLPIADMAERIVALASKSKTGKVMLVSHSYGGFVAEEVLSYLKGRGLSHVIESVALVAMPQSGAPQAIFSTLHGYGQSLGAGLIVSAKTAMGLAQNMPSAHHLLPSTAYSAPINIFFQEKSASTTVGISIPTPTDLGGVSDWLQARIAGVHGNVSMKNFSIQLPSAINRLLSNRASMWHDMQENNKASLEHAYNIWSLVGTGIPTVAGMKYVYRPCVKYPFAQMTDSDQCMWPADVYAESVLSDGGDGTVIFDGAQNRFGTVGLHNMSRENESRTLNVKHANILNSPDIQSSLTTLLKTRQIPLFNGYISSPTSLFEGRVIRIAVRGDITGGFRNNFNGIELRTEVAQGVEGKVATEQIPNSSIEMDSNGFSAVFLQADSESDLLRNSDFLSEKNQRADIVVERMYQVQEGIQVVSKTYESLSLGYGAKISFSDADPDILQIDTEGDGRIDVLHDPVILESIYPQHEASGSIEVIASTTVAGSGPRYVARDGSVTNPHDDIPPASISTTTAMLEMQNSLNRVALAIGAVPVYALKSVYGAKIEKIETAISTSKSSKEILAHAKTLHESLVRIKELESQYLAMIPEFERKAQVQSVADRLISIKSYLSGLGVLYAGYTEALQALAAGHRFLYGN